MSTKPRGAARTLAGGLAVAAGTLAIAVVAAEFALRFIVPTPNVYRMLLPGTRVFETDPRFVQGITGSARYVVNEHGLRGREFGADADEYRILLVGGSTTECVLLDETEHWGSIAERALGHAGDGRRVWVGNAGRSGLTSRDHAVTVKYLLPQYPRMDLIVILVGVNDLAAALRQRAAYRSPAPLSDAAAEQAQIRNAFALSPGGFREPFTSDMVPGRTPWHRRTRLFQLAKRARIGFQAREVLQGIAGPSLGKWRDHRRSAGEIIRDLPDLTAPLADYRTALEAIVRETRAAGVGVVFLTQPALWKPDITPAEERVLWLGGTGAFQDEPGHAYYAVSALAEAMARYNGVLLTLCRDERLSCLDTAAQVPADTSMFYDDVHFSEAGAALVGHLVAEHVRKEMPAFTVGGAATGQRNVSR